VFKSFLFFAALALGSSAWYAQSYRGVAQPGSAPALGAGCQRFKSARPDQELVSGAGCRVSGF
jgi:hypothetical protein